MPLQRYSKSEPMVFIWLLIPYVLVMNMLLFGWCIFYDIPHFLKTFFYSGIYFFLIYLVFGTVAIFIRNRIPAPGDLFKRIGIMLPVFYIMNVFSVLLLINIYVHFPLAGCILNYHMYLWAIAYGCIMSTVITFINEGISNWESWKASLAETEKLKNAYQRSRLLGLKGQINPHFLFNCFNTLSGLIPEDEAAAEKFLDEMTRVHRYLLRGGEEWLVPVTDELKFARSYLYLIQARFGEAIQTEIDTAQETGTQWMPPLSIQVILENIIYTNAIIKKNPLIIHIRGTRGRLVIAHTRHEKIMLRDLEVDEGLDNLITKYRLLNTVPVTIDETENERIITLPLFNQKDIQL